MDWTRCTLPLLLLGSSVACGSEPEPEYLTFKRGKITVEQSLLGLDAAIIQAQFEVYHQLVTEWTDPCSKETHGTCVATYCPGAPTAPPTTVEDVSAGTIRVESGSWHAELSLYGKYYPEVYVEELIFTGGEPFRFIASGAVVPAFDAAVGAPQRVEIMPRLDYCGFLDGGAEFTWSGGTGGEVVVTVAERHPFLGPGPVDYRVVKCRFDAAAGRGVVPAEAMAILAHKELAAKVAVESTTDLPLEDGWSVTLRIAETRDTCDGFFGP